MLCALIMAGGKGTRFWPLSTEDKPKQFLNLIGNKTMIQMTIDRILPIIPIERVFVCTGKRYIELVKEQLPNLPIENIIVEPEGRNTAPCIALSALIIKRKFSDANMVVLPSDHLIKDEKRFRDILESGEKYINSNKSALLTLGMHATRPETGYGYIKESLESQTVDDIKVVKVDKFVEKPNLEKAKEYISTGMYLWNGGMFLWNVDNIINNIKEYLPNTYEALNFVNTVDDCNLQKEIDLNYKNTDSISIDYGILEKSDNIYVIPSEFGWDDIGSWDAIERYRDMDLNGNIHLGSVTSLNSNNNIIISTTNNVIINGVNDVYVIENDGKIIIGKKSEVNRVKELRSNI